MSQFKLVENNIPSHLRVQVVYLHDGNTSRSKLRHIGKHHTKYVTIAKLVNKADGMVLGQGKAVCSMNDNPRRNIGRAIAVGRAFASYNNTGVFIDE